MKVQVKEESSHRASIKQFDRNQAHFYRIIVLGNLSAGWSDRLCNLRIYPLTTDSSEVVSTVILGLVEDQSQLLGVLNTLHDHRLSLLDVKLVHKQETSP